MKYSIADIDNKWNQSVYDTDFIISEMTLKKKRTMEKK